jgi:hypothetical protein
VSGEDELDAVGAPDVEVVGHQRLEERPGTPWCVEHHGSGDLDLAHRQLPPVARDAVVFGQGQRQRQGRHPPLEEDLDGP